MLKPFFKNWLEGDGMNKKALVTNIQRFSLHDGPGIRTTVFLKGCSLRCPWCANPENLQPYPEYYIKNNKRGVYGKYYSCDELFAEIIKDHIFYKQIDRSDELGDINGGVTLSGGEPLLQFDVLEPLLESLNEENIHICVETCLFVSEDKLEIAMKYIDLFYVDIKILDAERCRVVLGADIKKYYLNLKSLFSTGKEIVFRIPIIDQYTDRDENISEIIKLIKEFKPAKVELIKGHNLGKSKYISLGIEPPEFNSIADEKMDKICNDIKKNCKIRTEIFKV